MYDSSEDLSNQVTCAATSHLLCETNENQYKLRVIFWISNIFPTIEHFGQWHIPYICPFWYTTILFRPVKIHQKVREFGTKIFSRQNSVNENLEYFGVFGVFLHIWCFFGVFGVLLAYLVYFLGYLVFFAYLVFFWRIWCFALRSCFLFGIFMFVFPE